MRAAAVGVWLILLTGGLAAGPAALSAQACGVADGLGASVVAGAIGYDLGDGATGVSLGATAGARVEMAATGALELRVTYRRYELDAVPGVHMVRGRTALAVPSPVPGLTLCPMVGAGASALSLEGDRAVVWAGGPGVRLAYTGLTLGPLRTVPFAGVRGLIGHSTGRVFGQPAGETGYAVGVEAGVAAAAGPLVIRLLGSMDGLDDGLGLTPYPSRAAELAVGIRF